MQLTMKIKVFLLTLITALTRNNTAAFSSANINYRSYHNHSYRRASMMDTSNNVRRMMIPIGPIFDTTIAEAIQNAEILVSSEQNHEAQVYADLAHLILDFLTFVSGDGIVLRLLIFLGRICSILSDYVPDHKITFDELVFQSAMLAISTSMLLEKVNTAVSSLHVPSSFKDKRIYKAIFLPAGFTWIEYKTLLSSNVLQWIHYNPGTSIHYDCSLLITYKGEIQQENDGSTRFTKRYGVIGDLSQVPQFSESPLERNKSLKDLDSNYHERILCAGKEGLTLLKVDTKKLFEHGSEDVKISENAKNLYFNAMQMVLVSYSEAPSFPSSYPLSGNHEAKTKTVE